jgi:hypothetical protein
VPVCTPPNCHHPAPLQLYADFRPELPYWRLVLLGRKLALVLCGVVLSNRPMFQAAACMVVLFAAYALHVHFRPFLGA